MLNCVLSVVVSVVGLHGAAYISIFHSSTELFSVVNGSPADLCFHMVAGYTDHLEAEISW